MIKDFIKRKDGYNTDIEFWKKPPEGDTNNEAEYTSHEIRKIYYEPLIKTLKKYYNLNDKIKIHELGCGYGTNLIAIKEVFPNAILSGNDIWSDAIRWIKKNKPDITATKKETIAWIEKGLKKNEDRYDLIFTNAHLIHLKLEDLYLIENIKNMTKVAIFQEDIEGLDKLFEGKCISKEDIKVKCCNNQYVIDFEGSL